MRIKTSIVAAVVLVVVGVVATSLVRTGLFARSHSGAKAQNLGLQGATNVAPSHEQESADAQLSERLKRICSRADGDIGVAVIHVETGRAVAIEGAKQLPLYSVFKLPLAIAVLKGVEEKRLRLDQKVQINPAEVVPGWQGNSDLWRKPVARTVAELLELSLVRSDNTSSDKLLQLVGGPAAVTQRMRSLGFQHIDIHSTVREFASQPAKVNTGSAEEFARLLAQLHKGQVVQPSQLSLLLGLMERTTIGEHRLRGNLPAGTKVADKTGTGDGGVATNDVGLITLPNGRGHLAMAVFISGSKLPVEAQEKLIADLARAAFDGHTSRDAAPTQ